MSRAFIATPEQQREIAAVAREISTRRKALGMTQAELDRACGFHSARTSSIERGAISYRRSFLPTDHRVQKALKTLTELECDPDRARHKFKRGPNSNLVQRALRVFRTRSRRKATPTEISTVVWLCPDQATTDGPDEGVWITQAGCESMLKTNSVCRTRANGAPCGGVRFRRDQTLQRKTITVNYNPPKAQARQTHKLRPEDWT